MFLKLRECIMAQRLDRCCVSCGLKCGILSRDVAKIAGVLTPKVDRRNTSNLKGFVYCWSEVYLKNLYYAMGRIIASGWIYVKNGKLIQVVNSTQSMSTSLFVARGQQFHMNELFTPANPPCAKTDSKYQFVAL